MRDCQSIFLPMLTVKKVHWQLSPIDPSYATRINTHAVGVRSRKVKRFDSTSRTEGVASNPRAKTIDAGLARYPFEVTEWHYPMQIVLELTNRAITAEQSVRRARR